MIRISEKISILDKKITYKAIRSTGPGGQHINKVSTAILLRYDIKCYIYPNWFINNLKNNILKHQFSSGRFIRIKAKKYKSQSRNKKEAVNKLISSFKKSSIEPKKRKTKKISLSSKKKDLEKKEYIVKKNYLENIQILMIKLF